MQFNKILPDFLLLALFGIQAANLRSILCPGIILFQRYGKTDERYSAQFAGLANFRLADPQKDPTRHVPGALA